MRQTALNRLGWDVSYCKAYATALGLQIQVRIEITRILPTEDSPYTDRVDTLVRLAAQRAARKHYKEEEGGDPAYLQIRRIDDHWSGVNSVIHTYREV